MRLGVEAQPDSQSRGIGPWRAVILATAIHRSAGGFKAMKIILSRISEGAL
jgi:hypothetical protein